MPFLSKDWRSTGEEWVKTNEGWEKKKILECGSGEETEYCESDVVSESLDDGDKENIPSTTVVNAVSIYRRDSMQIQPHCHIIVKSTREIAGFNRLSDVFKRLDFCNAVRDIRRFNYIVKLLDILIGQKLTTLSGAAQKVLFTMLEEVACQVYTSQQNIHTLNKLLHGLQKKVEYYCWGCPLGSTVLWEQHLRTIQKINTIANRIEIRKPGDDMYPKLQNLPEECVREILLRMADHKDLQNSGKAYSVMEALVNEQHLWRELCKFHFSNQQLKFVLSQNKELCEKKDWQEIYHKLRRSFGLREEYAEMLQLCRNCRCLFWKSIGHPCITDQDPDFLEKLKEENVDMTTLHVPVPPHAFLQFFSL